jgi:hypothetical protein
MKALSYKAPSLKIDHQKWLPYTLKKKLSFPHSQYSDISYSSLLTEYGFPVFNQNTVNLLLIIQKYFQ